MTTITIEDIKAEQNKISAMILEFESKASISYLFPKTEISLAPGEHYAGLIIGNDGEPSHHLVLVPGDIEGDWERANIWAYDNGADLPTRREEALLFANLKDQFQDCYYWSSEKHASDSDYAWFQDFDFGGQYRYRKYYELRARAVRRLVIE